MENIIGKTMAYAIKCHEETNHLYDGKPYSTHLWMVYEEAKKYIYMVPDKERNNFLAAAFAHDVIEDCRQTYNDVVKATNKEIAELVYALTNEKGKIRKDRANNKYYSDMKKIPNAVLLKVCDRLANYKYSIQTGSDMAAKYKSEESEFVDQLYDIYLDKAFAELINLSN